MRGPSVSEVKDELLNHTYDDIQEYNNPLPSWWVGLFILTTVWSLFYIPYYATGSGATPEADYEADMVEWEKLHPTVTLASAEEMLVIVKDPNNISQGQKIYMERCLPCHAADGGGLVGPNLADEFWIHGGRPHEIAKTIYDGVPEKGMIPWKSLLSVDDIYALTAFLETLKGTTPAKPKAPEGNKISG